MNYTLFDTPVIKPLLTAISSLVLGLLGWEVKGEKPSEKKYVLIAAPHTSNWDLPFTLMVALVMDIKIYWMGKQQLFRFPFGGFMRWLGGIPVDRSKANNLVDATADTLRQAEELVIAVPPEGTRANTRYWKTGFYYIALKAQVPICLGFLDFGKRQGGLGPMLMPSGDIDADMEIIKAFYADKKGYRQTDFDDRFDIRK